MPSSHSPTPPEWTTPSAHAHSSLHSSLGISRPRSRVLCEEKPAGGSGLASPVVTCSVTSARCGCTVTAHTGALVSRIELGFFAYLDFSMLIIAVTDYQQFIANTVSWLIFSFWFVLTFSEGFPACSALSPREWTFYRQELWSFACSPLGSYTALFYCFLIRLAFAFPP